MGVVLILATLKLPSEFYYMLRYLISIGTVILLVRAVKPFKIQFVLPLVVFLILFNPIDPIYLRNKMYWMYIDIIGGLFYLYTAFKLEDFPMSPGKPDLKK
jgi:hypothetical protein